MSHLEYKNAHTPGVGVSVNSIYLKILAEKYHQAHKNNESEIKA